MKKITSNNIGIAIIIGSSIIAVAILANSLTNQALDENYQKKSEKIYENITYIKTTGSPFLGDPSAKIAIIEYIDFECPYCRKVHYEIFPQLKKEYIDTNKVKFIIKSMLINRHGTPAYKKSEAALCASDQGGNPAYFTYHDKLFLNYTSLRDTAIIDDLTSLASQQNLDTNQFRECLTSQKFKPIIDKEVVETLAIGAKGTPTWLIGITKGDKLVDTVKINGLHKFEVYQTIIDQLLQT
jgi:protein-disulfide isomerase